MSETSNDMRDSWTFKLPELKTTIKNKDTIELEQRLKKLIDLSRSDWEVIEFQKKKMYKQRVAYDKLIEELHCLKRNYESLSNSTK